MCSLLYSNGLKCILCDWLILRERKLKEGDFLKTWIAYLGGRVLDEISSLTKYWCESSIKFSDLGFALKLTSF